MDGNSIQDMGAYAPTIGKNIFKMSKKFKQKFRTYISTFYVHVTSFTENQYFFVSYVKRQKKNLVQRLF
jgi:hypothetical protein